MCGKKSVYYSKFAEAGFTQFMILLMTRGFKKLENVQANIELNGVDFIKWCGLVNAIPKTWRTWIREFGSNNSQPVDLPAGVNLNVGFIILINLKSRDLYLHHMGNQKLFLRVIVT